MLTGLSDSAAEDVLPLFIEGEEIIGCYKGIRDYVVFTNKRIISVNVQGVTGKKKDYTSLPYSKIQVFSIKPPVYLTLTASWSFISAASAKLISSLQAEATL